MITRRTRVALGGLLSFAVLAQAAGQSPATPTSPPTSPSDITPAAPAAAPTPTLTDEQRRALNQAADLSAALAGRAVLVMHEGRVVYERYDHGWDADRPHILASGVKSFCGVLAMAAVEDGLISLDEFVADTLTEWKADAQKSKITVRHLLTLSSGLKTGPVLMPRGRGAGGGVGEDGFASRRSRDTFADALAAEIEDEPGERFEYGPVHFFAFGAFLERKLTAQGKGERFLDYAQRRLFGPIGLSTSAYGTDAKGNPNLPGGMRLTARQWARFGQFVLDRGAVRQPDGTVTQVVRAELLAECFRRSSTNPAYGLMWWLPSRPADGQVDELKAVGISERLVREDASGVTGPDGKPVEVYMAAGAGKQRLFVIPAHRLVVVRFAEMSAEGRRFDNGEFLAPILRAFPSPAAASTTITR